MSSIFLACAVLGGGLLLVQLLAGVVGVGLDTDVSDAGHTAFGDGLNLFSVRALSAGLAFFGIAGMGAFSVGVPPLLALLVALPVGVVATIAVAFLLRTFTRFDMDKTPQLVAAIGERATVYLPVPGEEQGAGKVHVVVQGRLLECPAVTTHQETLPVGRAVIVTDVRETGTLEIIPATLPSAEVL